jgi:hypothetical protein
MMMSLRLSVKQSLRPLAAMLWAFLLCACVLPPEEELVMNGRGAPFDPDLYSWRTASWTPFTASDAISCIAWGRPGGRDRYVAAASTGLIAWSDDGDIWHRAEKYVPPGIPSVMVPDPFEKGINAIAWGSGRFVAAAGGGRIVWSLDGVKWTAEGYQGGIRGFDSEDIMGIAFGGGLFVAVGGNANISRSSDGIEWWSCRDPAFGTSRLNGIAYCADNGRFYIVGNDGKRGWSDNPASENWNYIAPEPPANTNNIRKVAVGRYGGGTGIGIVFDEWGGKRTAIATNGSFGGFDADLDSGMFGGYVINGIAWGGGIWSAAGQSAMIGWWPDAQPGSNSQRYWRALSFTEFQWWEISALAAGRDRFFAGNTGGKIGYSK